MPTRDKGGQRIDATQDFLHLDGVVFEPHVAPSSRWTARKKAALKKQNPGLHVRTTVDSPSVPQVDSTSVPLEPGSGTNGESISADLSGTDGESISRLATGVASSEDAVCLRRALSRSPRQSGNRSKMEG
jgi:hypothetical protein